MNAKPQEPLPAAPIFLGIDTGGTYTDAVLWTEAGGPKGAVLAKAKALEEEGLNARIWTGGYDVPAATILDSARGHPSQVGPSGAHGRRDARNATEDRHRDRRGIRPPQDRRRVSGSAEQSSRAAKSRVRTAAVASPAGEAGSALIVAAYARRAQPSNTTQPRRVRPGPAVVRAVVDWRGQVVTMADRAYLTHAMPMCVIWGTDGDGFHLFDLDGVVTPTAEGPPVTSGSRSRWSRSGSNRRGYGSGCRSRPAGSPNWPPPG